MAVNKIKKGLDYLKDLFGVGKKADIPTAGTAKPTNTVEDVFTKYDETTPPGQFKKQGEIIDEDGNVVTKEYSYNPESFTEMQKREGKGSFSEESLREQYMESVDADVMSYDEFVMKQRGITEAQLEAERAMRAKRISPEPKQVSTPESDKFISDVQAATNRSEEDIRETIVDVMNEGYEAGDPKRTMFDNDEQINAFLGVKKVNQGDFEEFVDDFLRRLAEREPSEYAPPVLRDKDTMKLGAGKRVFQDDDYQKSYDMLDEYGFRVTDDPSDIIPYSQLSEKDIRLVKLGVPMNSKKYKAQMQGLQEGKLLSELEDDPIKKANAKAFEDASGATERTKIIKANEDLKQKATDEIMEAIEEGNFDKAKEIEDAFNDGTYVPGGKKRTLNAKGGRIGFADGDFVAPEDVMTTRGDNESRIAEYMAKIETGELVYDPETKQFIPAPKKRRRQNTRPADNEEYMSDLMYRMKMNEMYGKKDGGRIGLSEGGGPKFSRRGFLGLMGAGLASLATPFGKIVSKAPIGATKQAIQKVSGMPDWFPLLVNRIKTKGRVTREPEYADFTSGGDTEKVYKLEDYIMYEDMTTGKITVSGRGNDYQQVSMEYAPGQTTVTRKQNPLTGEMEPHYVTDKPTFEAGEYAKGDPYDYENFGNYDDLKGDVRNWENFATGGRKRSIKEAEKEIDDFIEKYRNPILDEDFAKGGRVGMKQGGLASKFKEKVSYGN
jgi:hypothetical protein